MSAGEKEKGFGGAEPEGLRRKDNGCCINGWNVAVDSRVTQGPTGKTA